LVAALSSRAGLLLPDERTAGLNPLKAAAFRECASDERREVRTILLASHLLAGPEAPADPVTAIRDGKPAETGTPRPASRHTRQDTTAAGQFRGQRRARDAHVPPERPPGQALRETSSPAGTTGGTPTVGTPGFRPWTGRPPGELTTARRQRRRADD
jgi:ABC-2 type transport system ATP-binding protein